MGTWAADTFGNDTACDWIGTFLDDPGLPAVKSAIETVLDADGYLDSDDAYECLAACEVIARMQGKWGVQDSYSKALDKWIAKNPTTVPDDLKSAAITAIERIIGEDSELLELWDGDGRNEAWHRAIDDLRERIGG